jgi:hypothetical protein
MGMAIPVERWKECDKQVNSIKAKYGLEGAEIHTAWMLREYPEQRVVTDFGGVSFDMRRREVLGVRVMNLARARTRGRHLELKKNYCSRQQSDRRFQADSKHAPLPRQGNDVVGH